MLSVISAVYNKARYLPALLQNLREQAGMAGAVEYVFADDVSTDGSADLLEAEAARDPRIRVIRNAENAGPSIRFNQAAEAARGSWLLPVDPDDRLSRNAAAVFLKVARDHSADLVFARNRRGGEPQDIPAPPDVTVSDDPLLLAASRKIVRMGYLARAGTWRDAGGADERVFIQDQSLPLRLGSMARKAAFVDHVAYWLGAQESTSLSTDTVQQHHDRFLSMVHMLDRPLTAPQRRALERQMISAWWKMRRETGGGYYDALPAYLLNRLAARGLSPRQLARARSAFAALPDVRRMMP